jgi:hypothetical protein
MRVHKDAKPKELVYTPPSATPKPVPENNGVSGKAIAEAIVSGFRSAIAGMPAPVVHVEAPVVNVPKPEVRINSPVYVSPPDVKVPATTVHVPEGKAPVVNIEPAAVTLQTNRPNEWEFEVRRNEYGQIVTIRAKAIS